MKCYIDIKTSDINKFIQLKGRKKVFWLLQNHCNKISEFSDV